ncbi:similar to Saccharomyces cerevisiae YGL092W NUP145 Essential nucleoporin, subunit of the Nup84p subcomplex [Maudiozyma barnettii]|uniref:Similar to Saccharomyces cerevisiae YGL092W NUP145 Essential nucleoporin, subunit of the Nup84p subcomplex n=1 Tax=Maudiozyma barnettii TaxID=61262 RepID=A0A8H2VEU6_9SACH|nr:nucleocytoplasmic transporter NUP145 [Kazachstania barnettii]CAB4254270.1 similar to Saccharomyces cerevisiae YGL092W NUP145 Essential nucleoporin, subunit of the Nup84p subcomplex [Kazachstania barnettii]CAD1782051.1 similar to Saccharomyces cerevisiae YGL092W NUP145 Essential nucleoporin, subunit of the Nup84p subcomplex [Kazachstania barnettii]
MFGKTLGGQSTLGIQSASTPTSTPAPAMNNQLPQKTNSLFGNTTTNFGTSTPSPSGIFGNTANQNKPPTGGLFGNTTQPNKQPSNNLFGNTNTSNAPQTSTTGGLFGSKAQPPATTSNTGLFGNSNNTGGLGSVGGLFGNANKPVGGGSLFGNNTTAPQNGLQTGSVFGNSNTTVKPAGTSLFGNSSTTNVLPTTAGQFGNTATNSMGGGLFENKPATSNLAGSQSMFGNKPQVGGGLFGNPAQGNNNLSSGPSNTIKFDMSNMPKSITPSVQKQEATNIPSHSNRTSFSLPSKSHSEHQMLPSNIFGKLNTRLKYIKEKSTKGIFSSSSKGWSHLPYNDHRPIVYHTVALDKKKCQPMHLLSINSLEDQDVRNLRVLKIDPNRSAAKKLKLLPNIAVPTQQVVQSVDNLKHPISLYPEENNPIVVKEQTEVVASETSSLRDSKPTEENIDTSEKDINDTPSDYWCSPSPDELKKLSSEQLASVSNFIIGRKGYGTISFNYDVDLTSVARDVEAQLFGNIVIFNSSKTVEVYPDHSTKPGVGYGLNIPATISIEGVYPIDKKTKKPHVNPQKSSEIQLIIRRLKNMKEMEFISYNPFGGIWTFRVNHFSIWGLVDSEDVEMDSEDLKEEERLENNIQYDKIIQTRTLAQSNTSNARQTFGNDTQADLLVLQDRSFDDQEYKNTNDSELVEEKAFEPDVDEKDIELMEGEPSLEITGDWMEQLRIASSSNNSVFVKRFSQSKIEENAMTLLFSDFNQNFETMKKIVKERRMSTNYTFAKFDSRSKLLIKNINQISGTQLSPMRSSLNNDDLIMKSSLLDLHLKSVAIEQRKTNKYPIVKSHTLNFTGILPLIHLLSPEYEVWRLCSILHDRLIFPQEVKNETVKATLWKESRYRSLCDWVLDQIKDELNLKIKNTSDPLDKIFYLLFLNDNITAAKVAMSSNNAYLSVVLSFLGSNDPRVAEFASHQLEAWEVSGHQVEPKVRRIYEILGETFFNSRTAILKLLEDFSWLAVFGLGLFYGRIDENSLEDLVFSLITKIPNLEEDLRYVTLQLYSCNSDVEQLFKTLRYQNQQLGTQFSWYYIQILKFNNAKNFSNEYCDILTLDLIEDLRIEGFTEQALFVSCFIKNDRVAVQQISDLVSRNISEFLQNKMLLERLQIPESVIYSAAAVFDKYNGNYLSEIQNLLRAGSFKDAEKEMMLTVGPKLVLKYNVKCNTDAIETLGTFLGKFPKDKMDNWRNTLQVYEEFVDIILKDNQDNVKVKSIEDSLKLLMKFHNHKLVPACCNIIKKKLKAMQF